MSTRIHRRDVLLSADHPDFSGHFPNNPVFPAVSQIDLALRFLEEVLRTPLRLRRIRRAKFRNVLRPGRSIQLEIELLSEGEARWVLQAGSEAFSSGEFLYAPESDPPR